MGFSLINLIVYLLKLKQLLFNFFLVQFMRASIIIGGCLVEPLWTFGNNLIVCVSKKHSTWNKEKNITKQKDKQRNSVTDTRALLYHWVNNPCADIYLKPRKQLYPTKREEVSDWKNLPLHPFYKHNSPA